MDVAEITLRIVNADDILLHEGQDPLVVAKLAQRLQTDRMLRNPPIVSEANERYIILDGATRIACADSGAGMMPSALENWTAASNVSNCWTARASISP